ncbi:MAG: hypothetical protein RLZZ219_1364 [Cyanobacteriota bacterium]
MLTGVSIQEFTSCPGIRWRLKDPTTELLLQIEGQPDAQTFERYRAWFDRRYAGCFRLFEGRFPHDWLVNPEADPLAVHLAAGITALQRLGMQPVRRAQVLEADPARIRLALPSFNGTVLQAAIRLAIQLLLELDADPSGQGVRLRQLEEELEGFRVNAPGASRCGEETLRFALAADRLGIPVVATITGYLELGHGRARRILSNSLLNSSSPAVSLASDKLASYLVLHRAGIPVPLTRIINSEEDLSPAAADLGWPLVVKPLDGSLRRGVSMDVADDIGLQAAFRVARNVSQSSVLLQQQVNGREFRLTAIGEDLTYAREFFFATVVGDGSSSLAGLIERCNQDPYRGDHPAAISGRIEVGAEAESLLHEQSLGLDAVPAAGQQIRLSRLRGGQAGGHTVDASESLHPSYFALLTRIARVLQLDVVGIDLITPDPSRSWWEAGAQVIECNARPGLVRHEHADPSLRIYEDALSHGFGAVAHPRLIALAGCGEALSDCRSELVRLLEVCLAPGRFVGEIWDGQCRLGGEPLPLSTSERGQVGQALLADPSCGAALFAWDLPSLQSYGRPCESIDLAVLMEGAEPQLLEAILDADPPLVLWVGPGLAAAEVLIDRWRSRGEARQLLELASSSELAERLPVLLD